MKFGTKSLPLILMLCVGTIACKKENSFNGNATLTGKWLNIGSVQSAGGPTYFSKATSVAYLQFDNDGKMNWAGNDIFKRYTLKDSVTLNMHNADSSKFQNYFYTIRKDSLFISPRGPIYCIEGCSIYFVKVK